MSIIDVIKKSVLEQFDTSLDVKDVLFSLITAFLISLIIVLVYRKAFSGVVYSRSTALTIILLAMATSMIIRTINSNLSLSLGMVGALSIVRFRTAIKDPVDTAFLFWAVTAGIMSGTGLYLISIAGSLGIALIYYASYLVSVKTMRQYLLIVTYDNKLTVKVDECLGKIKRKQLKSKALTGGITEASYQVAYNSTVDEVMDELKNSVKVKSVNLVAYTNDFGM
jgi:Tfp pilus assembly major pilin PilA